MSCLLPSFNKWNYFDNRMPWKLAIDLVETFVNLPDCPGLVVLSCLLTYLQGYVVGRCVIRTRDY